MEDCDEKKLDATIKHYCLQKQQQYNHKERMVFWRWFIWMITNLWCLLKVWPRAFQHSVLIWPDLRMNESELQSNKEIGFLMWRYWAAACVVCCCVDFCMSFFFVLSTITKPRFVWNDKNVLHSMTRWIHLTSGMCKQTQVVIKCECMSFLIWSVR